MFLNILAWFITILGLFTLLCIISLGGILLPIYITEVLEKKEFSFKKLFKRKEKCNKKFLYFYKDYDSSSGSSWNFTKYEIKDKILYIGKTNTYIFPFLKDFIEDYIKKNKIEKFCTFNHELDKETALKINKKQVIFRKKSQNNYNYENGKILIIDNFIHLTYLGSKDSDMNLIFESLEEMNERYDVHFEGEFYANIF
jgi:hypothetical protein